MNQACPLPCFKHISGIHLCKIFAVAMVYGALAKEDTECKGFCYADCAEEGDFTLSCWQRASQAQYTTQASLPRWPVFLDLTCVTRKSAPARISQPPSFDSVPLSPKLRQPCSSPGLAGARASLDGVHSAKKGPSAKMPTPNDSVTKGHAGSCSLPARSHQHLCLQSSRCTALTAARC